MEIKTLGKYKIEGIIGRGAMGIIYEAYDQALQRKVAIKTMTSELINDPELRRRFYREARAAGNLRHPNIITIFDMGEDGETPYIVMELLHGIDLSAMIKENKNWPIAKILFISIQVAKGLHYAHAQGIVHRDIKPANVYICDDGMVKILDFGVAHVLSSTLTQTGKLLGSLGYMAPEQVMGKKVDGRSDIYSVGVILYELLTGLKPFIERDITNTIQAILKNPPVPVKKLREDCPPALSKIIMKCLQKTRDARFPDFSILAKDLVKVFEDLSAGEKDDSMSLSIISSIDEPTTETPGSEVDGSDQQVMSVDELLSKSQTLSREGRVPEAYSMMRDHYKLFQKDATYLSSLKKLREEKENFDKKTLFHKHYQEALKLVDVENFNLARLELETLLRIDGGSPLISKLEQQISQKEQVWEVEEWHQEGEKLTEDRKWEKLKKHIKDGDKKFKKIREYLEKRETLCNRREKLEVDEALAYTEPLEVKEQWAEAAEILRPYLRRFPKNRSLVEKYNHIMSKKLESDREAAQKKFFQEQLMIIDTLMKSKNFDQAQKYVMVLLEKFPGNLDFEEKMMELENCLEYQRSLIEIREYIENEDPDQAGDQFEIFKVAYPQDTQLDILQHELENLRMTLEMQSTEGDPEARLDNAIRLADKGAFDKALLIVRELMDQNPDHTAIYTNYLTIKTRKETQHKEELILGVREVNDLEESGELFQAMRKAQTLTELHPDEDTMIMLYSSLKNRYVQFQVENIQQAVSSGNIQEATALIESNLNLMPDESEFLELKQNINVENEKAIFYKEEIQKAKKAVRENRIDEAIEIVNALIPLNPTDRNLKRFLKDLIYKKTRSV